MRGFDGTAAVSTIRSTFEIDDLFRDPGRVDLMAPDEGFHFEEAPEPKTQRDSSAKTENV
jgi:hypothetical protein